MSATPEPGVSRIVVFSVVPDLWWNLSNPAACVMSSKTTGAPSTKPPAVIGRDRASFTGACATPVLMPLCCGESPRSGFCAGVAPGRAIQNKMRNAVRAVSRQAGLIDLREIKVGIESGPQARYFANLLTQFAPRSNRLRQAQIIKALANRFRGSLDSCCGQTSC